MTIVKSDDSGSGVNSVALSNQKHGCFNHMQE